MLIGCTLLCQPGPEFCTGVQSTLHITTPGGSLEKCRYTRSLIICVQVDGTLPWAWTFCRYSRIVVISAVVISEVDCIPKKNYKHTRFTDTHPNSNFRLRGSARKTGLLSCEAACCTFVKAAPWPTALLPLCMTSLLVTTAAAALPAALAAGKPD